MDSNFGCNKCIPGHILARQYESIDTAHYVFEWTHLFAKDF